MPDSSAAAATTGLSSERIRATLRNSGQAKNMLRSALILFALISLALALQAHAYIGPGAGVGVLGSLWAWLVGILVVLMAILVWPIRWALRRLRNRAKQSTTTAEN